MKVAVESIGSFQRKIQITFPADRVASELDSAFKTLGRRVRLPGFRPGKAPRKVLEARYGGDIRSDVANNLIQSGYRKAIEGEKLEPVGQPTLDDTGELKHNAEFSFTVLVDVKPSVSLTKVKGVDVVYPVATISDEEVEANVRARLEGQARLVEVTDRGVEKGDMVLVELEVKDGKEVVANEPGTMIRTEADPYYPGIEDFLVGTKAGKSKKGKVTFGADARTEAVAGKELSVNAKVLSIQANEVPALDDALAEELGYEGGAGGMRNAIRGDLQTQRENLARNQARANLLEALIAANPFDVPAGMVDTSLKMLMDELRLQQAYMGRDPRSLSFSDAQIADLRIRAEFASKAGLILEKVSETEKIEITDKDLDAKYAELASERGQSVEAVKGYFVKDEAVEELKARMLEEKTLDWLLERANLVDEGAKKAAPKKAAKKDEPKAEAAAEEKPKAKAKGKAKKDEAPAAGADLSVLDGAVGKVKEAIESGAHDADLAELLAAEQNGKARKGALAAIEKRIADTK
ncbi:MAG: trigger factor [Alphaproteobacteria bacterium]|nr:trigger factor [Alphaproteobacteria bacterium]